MIIRVACPHLHDNAMQPTTASTPATQNVALKQLGTNHCEILEGRAYPLNHSLGKSSLPTRPSPRPPTRQLQYKLHSHYTDDKPTGSLYPVEHCRFPFKQSLQLGLSIPGQYVTCYILPRSANQTAACSASGVTAYDPLHFMQHIWQQRTP